MRSLAQGRTASGSEEGVRGHNGPTAHMVTPIVGRKGRVKLSKLREKEPWEAGGPLARGPGTLLMPRPAAPRPPDTA